MDNKNNNVTYSKTQLEQLIREVVGVSSVPPVIARQINRLILVEDFTYKEIARCIVYYNEVQGQKVSPIYGIAFCSNIRELAAKYFRQLELEQLQQNEEAKKMVKYQDNNIIFNINMLPHKKRQPKQLDIKEIDIEGDN